MTLIENENKEMAQEEIYKELLYMVGPDIVTDNQTIVCYGLNPDTTVSL